MKKTIKTIDVYARSEEMENTLNKWASEEPDCVSQILEAGYNEGIVTGHIAVGLALMTEGGLAKLIPVTLFI